MLRPFVASVVKTGVQRILPGCRLPSRFHARPKSTKQKVADEEASDAEDPVSKKRSNEDLRNNFSATDLEKIIETFPTKLMTRRRVHPDALYICHPEGAALIAKHVLKDLDVQKPLVEINPGPGLLTRHLVETRAKDIRLFEREKEFHDLLCERHETDEQVDVQFGDFLTMMRMSYNDPQDIRRKASRYFSGITHTEWAADDVSFRLFSCVGTVAIFKYLIQSVVFQANLMAFGRPELYFALPPHLYTHITCDSSAGLVMYRNTTILFQILFTHELIAKIPRKYFLPYAYAKQNKYDVSRLTEDHENIYLVKAVPRRNLFDIIPVDQLPALYFFIRHNCFSRRNRIIPCLEKWVPGAGHHLILHKPSSSSLQSTSDSTLDTTASQQLSRHEYFDKINIFTTFGDLSPSQFVTLYFQFASMPGYAASTFTSLMESMMVKSKKDD